MKVLIATKNQGKIEGAKRALENYFNNVEIEGIPVNSDVPDQPVNKEIYIGAKNRVKNLKEYAKNILSWNGSESDKPRVFLQELGTDLIKNKIDEHMLIKRVIEDIKVYSYFYDVIVISDARYIDEIELIKKEFNNVITIHINSNNCILNNHITETSLDNYNNYDYVIDNNGSIDELCLKVKEVLFNE